MAVWFVVLLVLLVANLLSRLLRCLWKQLSSKWIASSAIVAVAALVVVFAWAVVASFGRGLRLGCRCLGCCKLRLGCEIFALVVFASVLVDSGWVVFAMVVAACAFVAIEDVVL